MGQEEGDDESVQSAVRNMFLGVAPERKDELLAMWADGDWRFNVVPDDGKDGKLVMDAGCYRHIRFNHRVMRVFWVAAFAAWESYRHCAESSEDLTYLRELLGCVESILQSPDPEIVSLPSGVPPPGTLESIPVTAKATGELAIFAVGWALLHEVRHVRHQREGTSAGYDASSADLHAEEFSCDEFATRFMLEKVGDYATDHAVAEASVMQKRQAGIHFALFAMTLIGLSSPAATGSHPPLDDRISSVWNIMRQLSLSAGAAAIAVGAYETLLQVRSDAPHVPTDLLLEAAG